MSNLSVFRLLLCARTRLEVELHLYACEIVGCEHFSVNFYTTQHSELWFHLSHAVLKIFTSTVQHKRMLADGTLIDIKREPEHL